MNGPTYTLRSREASLLEADQLARNGRVELATELLDEYLKTNGFDADVWIQKGRLLMLGDIDAALACFTDLLAQAPAANVAAEAYALRALCHDERRRPRNALADYERALNLGLADHSERQRVAGEAAAVYLWLHTEKGGPVQCVWKARFYAAKSGGLFPNVVEWILDVAGGLGLPPQADAERLSSELRDRIAEGVWRPVTSVWELPFGQPLPFEVLPLVYYGVAPQETWLTFQAEGGVLYTDGGVLSRAKARARLRLDGWDLIGAPLSEVERRLGPAYDRGEARGDPYIHYDALDASIFYEDGRVVEAIVGGVRDDDEGEDDEDDEAAVDNASGQASVGAMGDKDVRVSHYRGISESAKDGKDERDSK